LRAEPWVWCVYYGPPIEAPGVVLGFFDLFGAKNPKTRLRPKWHPPSLSPFWAKREGFLVLRFY
jgi:hypothetical protein